MVWPLTQALGASHLELRGPCAALGRSRTCSHVLRGTLVTESLLCRFWHLVRRATFARSLPRGSRLRWANGRLPLRHHDSSATADPTLQMPPVNKRQTFKLRVRGLAPSLLPSLGWG